MLSNIQNPCQFHQNLPSCRGIQTKRVGTLKNGGPFARFQNIGAVIVVSRLEKHRNAPKIRQNVKTLSKFQFIQNPAPKHLQFISYPSQSLE